MNGAGGTGHQVRPSAAENQARSAPRRWRGRRVRARRTSSSAASRARVVDRPTTGDSASPERQQRRRQFFSSTRLRICGEYSAGVAALDSADLGEGTSCGISTLAGRHCGSRRTGAPGVRCRSWLDVSRVSRLACSVHRGPGVLLSSRRHCTLLSMPVFERAAAAPAERVHRVLVLGVDVGDRIAVGDHYSRRTSSPRAGSAPSASVAGAGRLAVDAAVRRT